MSDLIENSELVSLPETMEEMSKSKHSSISIKKLYNAINSVQSKYTDYNKFANLYTTTIKPIYNYLRGLGYTSQQAAGIMGNMLQESMFDNSIRGGLTLFRGAHLDNYNRLYKNQNWKTHLDYINSWKNSNLDPYEGKNWNYGSSDYNKASHATAADSAAAFYTNFERANDDSLNKRLRWASIIYNWFNGTSKLLEGGTMKIENITIGDESYKVIIADTEETRQKGLMGVQKLPEGKGMLFIFDNPGDHQMYMKNTLIPLQQIFIDKSGEVLKTVSREPNDETLIGCPETKYVLEVNPTNTIEEGDFMEGINGLEDAEDNKVPTMKILAPDGSALYYLLGGERIFSRRNTIVLIRLAKKAYLSKEDKDYRRLGKSVFKYLKIQDNNKPEYVLAPK